MLRGWLVVDFADAVFRESFFGGLEAWRVDIFCWPPFFAGLYCISYIKNWMGTKTATCIFLEFPCACDRMC